MNGAYKKDRDKLFSRACSDRTRHNEFKLKERRLRLDTRKKFFTLRVVRHWHRFPREVGDAPSLESFKARVDGALSNLSCRCPCSLQGVWTRRPLKVPSSQNYSDFSSLFLTPEPLENKLFKYIYTYNSNLETHFSEYHRLSSQYFIEGNAVSTAINRQNLKGSSQMLGCTIQSIPCASKAGGERATLRLPVLELQ